MQGSKSVRARQAPEAPEGRHGEPGRGRVIAILGMHRSGTSAITRGLQALGVSLGDDLMPPVSGNNDKGFFEDLDIYHFNERLLKRAASARHKLSALNADPMTGPDFSAERREATALLERKSAGKVFAFKDPRTALLLPFWQCVFEDLELEDRYVLCVRNPIEAAVSVHKRDGIDLAKGMALWAKHVIEALRHTQAKPRAFVAYDRVLGDPFNELRRMADALGLSAPNNDSDAVIAYCEQFVARDLRHNRVGIKELERSGLAPAFVIELYDLVAELAAADDANAAIDAGRVADIVSRFDEIAPLLAYADRIEDDRVSARGQIEAAAQKTRELESALQKAMSERQAAAQQYDDAKVDLAKLECELQESRLAAEIEQKRLADEIHTLSTASRADAAAHAAETDALRTELASLTHALDDAREDRARLTAQLGEHAEKNRRLTRALADAHEDHARLTAQLKERAETNERLQADLHAAHQALDEERAASRRRLDEARKGERNRLAASAARARDLAREVSDLREQSASSLRQYRDCRRDLLLARAAVTEMRRSTSWRLTAPLRAVGALARNPVGSARAAAVAAARAAWRGLPMPAEERGKLAARIFSAAPAFFAWSQAYKNWAATRREDETDGDGSVELAPDPALEGYVPLLATAPPQSTLARAIAFYLPQFHPIPENSAWWGEGFTEWTKVKAAEPRFEGHYQPHEPGELGYYDLLRDDGVMRRQAELAKLHGVSGFCFYFYWFAGKRLLEAPIEKFRDSPDIDMPFCLCWANENWTRRWDGKANEILIAQQHSPDDDIAFISHVSRYFKDPRYIRVGGRPLLLVYRPALLPSAKATADRWRRWLRENGFGEVYLAYTQSFEHAPPAQYGFDAAVEFPPNNMGLASDPALVSGAAPELSIYDWGKLKARAKRKRKPSYTLFRGVTPCWDNTPRRPRDGAVFVNASPSAFSDWLTEAVRDTVARFADPQERLVFINAWNEWAEGAHLEPDRRYGYAWLEAARRALDPDAGRRKLIVVTHDLHRHGAQFIALNLIRTLRSRFGLEVTAVSGEDGPLRQEFETEAPLRVLDPRSTPDEEIEAALAALAAQAFRHAVVNSAASGWIAPKLAAHGVKTIGLVHELPSMIARMNLRSSLRDLDGCAEALVFPAAVVRDRDAQAAALPAWRNAAVMPQGLYKPGVIADAGDKQDARGRVAAKLGLPANARIVLGVGYADMRKGVDIFIAWAAAAAKRWPDLHFVWLGAMAPELSADVERWLAGAGAQRAHIHFPGFIQDTQELYAAAALYALSSREDPFPSTALEALAAATPVVTVRGTGGIEGLAAHGCVKAIDGAGADAFVAGAAEWLDSADAAVRAGLCGRDLVRERFGFASYAGALTDLLGLDVPNISVVVPNYNYARHLEQRLKSILEQTLSPREIIFLDDASSDNSIAVAERVLSDASVNWRIVRNAQNSGDVFAQWRKGAELAQGDLVWIAEADDWADPRFLETASRAFRRSDVVLSMTQSQQAGADGAILAGDYLDYVRDVSPDKWRRAFVGDGPAEVREGLAVKNTIPNVSAVLFRRNPLLDVLGAYGREIGSYRVAGDWCVYVNLMRRGALAFSPAALNIHRRHDASVTIAKFGLAELAEIARMQAYVAREFAPQAATAQQARAYLEKLVAQFGLERRFAPSQIEGALRGVTAHSKDTTAPRI